MIPSATNGLVSDPTRNRVSADIRRPSGPAWPKPSTQMVPCASTRATASPAPARCRTRRSMRSRSCVRITRGRRLGHQGRLDGGQQILGLMSLDLRRLPLPGDGDSQQRRRCGCRRQHHPRLQHHVPPSLRTPMISRPSASPQPRETPGLWRGRLLQGVHRRSPGRERTQGHSSSAARGCVQLWLNGASRALCRRSVRILSGGVGVATSIPFQEYECAQHPSC